MTERLTYFWFSDGKSGRIEPITAKEQGDFVLLTSLAKRAQEEGGAFLEILEVVKSSSKLDDQILIHDHPDEVRSEPPPGQTWWTQPEQKAVDVIMVWRIRGDRKLPHTVPEMATALVLDDRQAFNRLLQLSGLDAHEIKTEGLDYRRLGGPAALLDELSRLTADEYGMASQRMLVPLPDDLMDMLAGGAKADGF